MPMPPPMTRARASDMGSPMSARRMRSAVAPALAPGSATVAAIPAVAVAFATTCARAAAYRSPVRSMRARTRDFRCFRSVISSLVPGPAAHAPRTSGATAVLERTRWRESPDPRTSSPLPPLGRSRGDRRGGSAWVTPPQMVRLRCPACVHAVMRGVHPRGSRHRGGSRAAPAGTPSAGRRRTTAGTRS